MPNLGPFELIIILVIIVIIFGVGKLPQIGGALGRGINEFRTATQQPEEEKESEPPALAEEEASQSSQAGQ